MKKFFLFLFIAVAGLGCLKPELEKPVDRSYHRATLGSAARDLLSEEKFTRLVVEIQYMPGFMPDSVAVKNLALFLQQHLHKPQGIHISVKEIPPSQDTLHNLQEVLAIENAHRRLYNEDNTIALYILYTNGVYIDTKLLGYAYHSTSAVIFGKNIWENSNRNRRPRRSDLETKVLQHEIGHLLGLVNNGSSQQSHHTDEAHGKHCENKKCLMYYLIETEESPSFLMKKPLPKLDADCLADLRANGGK